MTRINELNLYFCLSAEGTIDNDRYEKNNVCLTVWLFYAQWLCTGKT
jgi:hypothetical protein